MTKNNPVPQVGQKISVPFSEAKSLLREGDVLLFRGRGLASFFIQRAGEGKYSHVGVASAHGDNGGKFWECVEFREWKGGRTISLERYVQQNSGVIDVYRPKSCIQKAYFDSPSSWGEYEACFDGKKVTNLMRKMTGLPYGWKRIWWIATRKIPFLRFLYDVDSIVKDYDEQLVYPVCSTAVSYCFSRIDYDLTHHRSDNAMEPNDVARSPLLHYFFTLTA